ncbi:MAG: transglycosylase SLT domain-containing protein [Pseudomonadota bacterium]
MTQPTLPPAAMQLGERQAAQSARLESGAVRQIARNAAQVDVQQAIASAAQQTTVDFDFLVAQAQVESAMNPKAKAPTSSATGLYQFIESTWLSTMKRHGPRFGLGDVAAQIGLTQSGYPYVPDAGTRDAILALREDPQIASLMAAGLAEDNRADLTPILGRQPDKSELYLAHFLGSSGAGRFLSEMQADPNQSAAALFRRPAAANRAVFYEPGGAPRSLAGVMNHLGAKMDRALANAPLSPQPGYSSVGGSLAAFPTPDQAGAYPAYPGQAVPYLITAEEVFEPANPPVVTASRTRASLPASSAARPAPSSSAMSTMLSSSIDSTSANSVISPESAERIKRAYSQLRAMGL